MDCCFSCAWWILMKKCFFIPLANVLSGMSVRYYWLLLLKSWGLERKKMIMGLFRLLESALTSLYPFISQVTELCWKDNLTGYWRSSGVTYRSPECYLPEALCLLGCSASPAPQSCSACLSSRVTLRVCSLLFVHIPPLLLFIYLFIVAPPPPRFQYIALVVLELTV